MQDLENNMDDLFRKAVDNYGLEPGESKWDEIVPRLESSAIASSKKKNNSKKYGLILLLFALLTLGGGIFLKYANDKKDVSVTRKSSTKNLLNNPSKDSNTVYKTQHEEEQLSDKKNYSLKQNPLSQNNAMILKMTQLSSHAIVETKNDKEKYNVSIPNNDMSRKSLLITISQNQINQSAQKSDSLKQKEIKENPATSAVNKSITKKKQQGIYFGLVSGVSFNEVKSQGLKKPGFDLGIIAGYQINRKASIETGILLNHKYYFTDGKYFNMNKIGSSMPPEMKVLSIEGSSTVFEIPVRLKYNMVNKTNNAFFSSAGLSSYLLTKEKNNYFTLMNGTKETITSSYKNSSRYFAAAVNISAGYEHTIGNYNNKIRVEPYVQIPLKGIGMGSLPVMSTGLRVGFTLSPH